MRKLFLSAALLCASASAREVPITVIHTCDLHGNVLPTESYEGSNNVGGIARCATMIREIRAHEKNVLLVDAGDTIQGAAVSFLSDGQVMVKCLNSLHYDAWTWGNHEFDWGLPKLAACAEKAQVPIVAANIVPAKEDGNKDSREIVARIKPYVIREMDGVKVGIIGLDTPGVPHWSRPRLIAGLEFEDSIATLRKIVPEARKAGAQVLIVVCHQGYREAGDDHANQVNAIAHEFPEVDVIIGAHTHRNFPEFKISNVLYSQADYYGIYLGRVDVVYDTDKRRVVKRQSNTLLMDEKVALDRDIVALTSNEVDRARQAMSVPIGEATDDFWIRALPRKETPVHDLIFEAIDAALRERGVTVDAVVHGIFERRDSLHKGVITVGDVWKMMPYENTIGVIQVTPAELREVLDENVDAFENNSFRGIWGLRWTFNPDARKGERTVDLRRADGTALDEKRKLLVAFNSYDLASGGQRWKRLRALADRPESHLVEYEFQTRAAVVNYVRKRGQITPVVGNWWTVKRSSSATPAADSAK